MPRVLVIAGSDSSGGAGITRDLAVLAEHHVDACCAITAITAQTDNEVAGIHHVPAPLIRQQIATAFAAHHIDVIKLGMLGCADSVVAVATALTAQPYIPLILDPVLCSSSGTRLLDDAGVDRLREQLLPRALLLTPNLFEAAHLLREIVGNDEAQLIAQGRRLLQMGPEAVLIKGGHSGGDIATDLLIRRNGDVTRFASPRIAANMRGTGCALASAIAAQLAQSASLESACESAKTYVRATIQLVAHRRADHNEATGWA